MLDYLKLICKKIKMLQEFVSFYEPAILFGILGEVLVILWLFMALSFFPKSGISVLFETLYEKMYYFFQDILGKEIQFWVLKYVLTLFSVIFISNSMSLCISLISPFFGISQEWEFILEHYITVPSADIHFNLAMAIMSMCVIIYVQFKASGVTKFLYEYFPIFWKKYITIERGNMKSYIYYPLSCIAKIFDICISLFLGILDVGEYLARTISLSFRLFGNMTSWGVLMGIVYVGIGSVTTSFWAWIGKICSTICMFFWFERGAIFFETFFAQNFPIIVPVFLYAEEFLVTFIQAMVFSLLVTIFIKVALAEVQEEKATI